MLFLLLFKIIGSKEDYFNKIINKVVINMWHIKFILYTVCQSKDKHIVSNLFLNIYELILYKDANYNLTFSSKDWILMFVLGILLYVHMHIYIYMLNFYLFMYVWWLYDWLWALLL